LALFQPFAGQFGHVRAITGISKQKSGPQSDNGFQRSNGGPDLTEDIKWKWEVQTLSAGHFRRKIRSMPLPNEICPGEKENPYLC
jgi:hypothetical protein